MDDEPHYLRLFERRLTAAGFSVTAVDEGARAVQLAGESPFDLVFLDWVMPSMPGEAVLKLLRAAPTTRSIPIVLYSGIRQEAEDEVRARELGADAFMTKREIVNLLGDRETLLRRVNALSLQGGKTRAELKFRILVADDDAEVRELVRFSLSREGHDVVFVGDGEAALRAARAEPPDLIILDLMMPELNGIDTHKKLAEQESTRGIPVLFMSAVGDSSDLLKSISVALGSGDYVNKPFKPDQLAQSVKRMLAAREPCSSFESRATASAPEKHEIIRRGCIRVDERAQRVWVNGRIVDIHAPRRFALLCCLMRNEGGVSREALLQKLWGTQEDVNTLEVTVHRLRQDLGPKASQMIVTIPGGYQLTE